MFLIERLDRGSTGRFRGVPSLCPSQIHGDKLQMSPSLLTRGGTMCIIQKVREGGQQEAAQPATSWIGFLEKAILEHADEEGLGAILRICRAQATMTCKGIQGIPISLAKVLQRCSGPCAGIIVPRPYNHSPTCRRKSGRWRIQGHWEGMQTGLCRSSRCHKITFSSTSATLSLFTKLPYWLIFALLNKNLS